MISRRTFTGSLMATTAVVSTGLGVKTANALQVGDFDITKLEGISNKLPLPPIAEPSGKEGDVTVFDFDCQYGETEFLPGLKSVTMGMNAPYLAPILVLKKGEKYKFNFTNNTYEKIAVHWHGLDVPAIADGGVHQMFSPGKTWSPEFQAINNSGNYWFHAHAKGRTAEHAYMGLAGWLVICDEDSKRLKDHLPSTLGVDDFPLVIQDKNFLADGTMKYNLDIPMMLLGQRGDVMIINGVVNPYVEATTTKIKLRILSGVNARYFSFGFKDNRPFQLISTDGGLLEKPVELTRLPMTPAERAEIIVELKPGETLDLMSFPDKNHEYIRDLAAEATKLAGYKILDDSEEIKILEIRAAAELKESPAVPAQLIEKLAMPDETESVRTREFILGMDMMADAKPGDVRSARFANALTINDKAMDEDRIDEYCEAGTTEIWEFTNASSMPHNMHIHCAQFKVLDRNGNPPEPFEVGLKDTVNIDPGDVVRLVIKHTHYTDPDHPYMFHCHILEHEDQGMMAQFVVV